MALLSAQQDTVYDYEIANVINVKYRTITRFDPDLMPGHTQVIQSGQQGKRVDVYRVAKDGDGNVISRERVSRDFYQPTHEIVLQATTEPETESDHASVEQALLEQILTKATGNEDENRTEDISERAELDFSSISDLENLTDEQLSTLFTLLFLAAVFEGSNEGEVNEEVDENIETTISDVDQLEEVEEIE